MARFLVIALVIINVGCGVNLEQHRRDLAELKKEMKTEVAREVEAGMERSETRFGSKLNEQMMKVHELLQLEPELKSLKTKVDAAIKRVNTLSASLEGKVIQANKNVLKSLEAQKMYLEDLLLNIEALLGELREETMM